MNAPPPPDPRALAGKLALAITAAFGPDPGEDPGAPKTLRTILVDRIVKRAAAPPPDPEALAKLAADLDQLEDLLEALALTTGPARAG